MTGIQSDHSLQVLGGLGGAAQQRQQGGAIGQGARIARRGLYGAVVRGQGLLEPAQVRQRDAQIAQGVGKARREDKAS
jgi:hypothetical protein